MPSGHGGSNLYPCCRCEKAAWFFVCFRGPCKDPSLKPFLPGPAFVLACVCRGTPPTNTGIFFLSSLGVSLWRIYVFCTEYLSCFPSQSIIFLFPFIFLLFLILFCLSPSFFLFKENIYWLPRVLVATHRIFIASWGADLCCGTGTL